MFGVGGPGRVHAGTWSVRLWGREYPRVRRNGLDMSAAADSSRNSFAYMEGKAFRHGDIVRIVYPLHLFPITASPSPPTTCAPTTCQEYRILREYSLIPVLEEAPSLRHIVPLRFPVQTPIDPPRPRRCVFASAFVGTITAFGLLSSSRSSRNDLSY